MARPFIPVPGVFKVQLVMSYQGQRIENVFNVKSGAGLTVTDADRIEAVFANWWNTSMRLQVGATCTLVLIILDALDAAASLHKEYTTGWTAAGAIASTAMPGNVTSSVKLATGIRGRSFRGRFYWPALSSSQISGGQLLAATQTAIQTAANALRTSLAADAAADKLVVVSYMAGGVWRSAGVATEVTSCSAHANLDSMRRRLPGRGL